MSMLAAREEVFIVHHTPYSITLLADIYILSSLLFNGRLLGSEGLVAT